jgi:hypothetical protein
MRLGRKRTPVGSDGVPDAATSLGQRQLMGAVKAAHDKGHEVRAVRVTQQSFDAAVEPEALSALDDLWRQREPGQSEANLPIWIDWDGDQPSLVFTSHLRLATLNAENSDDLAREAKEADQGRRPILGWGYASMQSGTLALRVVIRRDYPELMPK